MDDAEWLSQHDAARQLGVAVIRIGALVACGHLAAAENRAGQAGVTITSVQAEKGWRETASTWAKFVRLLKDSISFL
ncbi:DNA-binding protein [Streptomyces sp. NPDC059176]|uniref:DNA-binding protein n=1 Tax=Streptomyces sp. NPDC059176 TaxID=3346758 RepID=UPI0036B02CC1